MNEPATPRTCQTRTIVAGDPNSPDRVKKSQSRTCGMECLPGKSTCARHAVQISQSILKGLATQHFAVIANGGNHADYIGSDRCPFC